MPPRPFFSRARVVAMAVLAGLLGLGCSSSEPRDMNDGTDAGLDFVIPDAPLRTDTAPSPDALPDAAAASDEASPYDTSIDGSSGEVS